jgi:hypothetical protein
MSLQTGKLEMLEWEKAPRPPWERLPPAVEKAGGAGLWVDGAWTGETRSNGRFALTVVRRARAGKGELVLERRRLTTGERLPDVKLASGPSPRIGWSADHKAILIGPELTAPNEPEERHTWRVFSTETGKAVGRFEHQGVVMEVTALGKMAYCSVLAQRPGDPGQRLYLRAIDLQSGKQSWEAPVVYKSSLWSLP